MAEAAPGLALAPAGREGIRLVRDMARFDVDDIARRTGPDPGGKDRPRTAMMVTNPRCTSGVHPVPAVSVRS